MACRSGCLVWRKVISNLYATGVLQPDANSDLNKFFGYPYLKSDIFLKQGFRQILRISDHISSYLAHEPGAEQTLELALTNLEISGRQLASVRQVKSSLLFTDIVNSAAIFDSFGDDYGREIVSIHDDIVKSVITNYGGNYVKGTGDGILASFDSCGRSVKSAILIPKQFKQHKEQFPLLGFDVRIGPSSPVRPLLPAHYAI